MSLQLRCNCGWTSQVSEYYLGDRVTCPECGTRLGVNPRANVPYAYAPYPTWGKRPAVRTPQRRRAMLKPQNPHAVSAVWLGMVSTLLVFTGCGIAPGALLALGGVFSWYQSRRFAIAYRQQQPARATVGLMFSLLSLFLAAAFLLALFIGPDSRPPREIRCYEQPPVEQPAPGAHEFRYPDRDADWYTRQAEKFREQEAEWQRMQQEKGYRYPVAEPERTPVEPRNDFQRYQQELSERVRRQREAGYRYQD